jgi:ketosteroid isomerase-like protein
MGFEQGVVGWAGVTDADALDLLTRFNAAWNARDLDAALALCTPDCVFESTGPAPDGARFEGSEQLREAWRAVFDNPASRFEFEELLVAGGRLIQRWRYDGGRGHIRGIDLIRLRDGRIAEKLSYVKG